MRAHLHSINNSTHSVQPRPIIKQPYAQLCTMASAKKGATEMQRKKELAQELFINSEMSQDEIAQKLGIAPRTLWKWKTDGCWDEEKAATRITNRQIILGLYKRLNALIDGNGSSDEIAKIASSIEKLKDEKVTISAIINSFKDFTTFAFMRNPELARQIVTLQNEFVTKKLSDLSK